jgi:hypothetical protein
VLYFPNLISVCNGGVCFEREGIWDRIGTGSSFVGCIFRCGGEIHGFCIFIV